MSDPVGSLFNGLVQRQIGPGGKSGTAEGVIRQIREDAWNGSGPQQYTVPKVRGIYVSERGGGLPDLYLNGRAVGPLHGGSDEQARAVAAMVAGQPTDIELSGHYGNTVFYIDQIGIA